MTTGKTIKRVGLAVMDAQTLHRGHNNLLNEVRMSCDEAIVGLGSVRKSGIPGHPFTFAQRAEMVRTIHGDFFSFVPLDDIDASHDIRAWYRYVEAKIEKAGLPKPTDYFGGSRIDAKWYFHAFCDPETGFESRSAGSVTFEDHESGRRLHIVDRTALGLPSGREVRLLIETRDEEWKRYVPERLHGYIEHNYPPHLRHPLVSPKVRLSANGKEDPPSAFDSKSLKASILSGEVEIVVEGDHPVGTRLSALAIAPGKGFGAKDDLVLELKDDGRWRPLETRDEKTEWAIAARQGD